MHERASNFIQSGRSNRLDLVDDCHKKHHPTTNTTNTTTTYNRMSSIIDSSFPSSPLPFDSTVVDLTLMIKDHNNDNSDNESANDTKRSQRRFVPVASTPPIDFVIVEPAAIPREEEQLQSQLQQNVIVGNQRTSSTSLRLSTTSCCLSPITPMTLTSATTSQTPLEQQQRYYSVDGDQPPQFAELNRYTTRGQTLLVVAPPSSSQYKTSVIQSPLVGHNFRQQQQLQRPQPISFQQQQEIIQLLTDVPTTTTTVPPPPQVMMVTYNNYINTNNNNNYITVNNNNTTVNNNNNNNFEEQTLILHPPPIVPTPPVASTTTTTTSTSTTESTTTTVDRQEQTTKIHVATVHEDATSFVNFSFSLHQPKVQLFSDLFNGQLPSNSTVDSMIENSLMSMSNRSEELNEHGKMIAHDLDRLLRSFQQLMHAKNDNEQLQKIVLESFLSKKFAHEMIRPEEEEEQEQEQTRAMMVPSVGNYDQRATVAYKRDMFANLKQVIVFMIENSRFREFILGYISIMRSILLGRKDVEEKEEQLENDATDLVVVDNNYNNQAVVNNSDVGENFLPKITNFECEEKDMDGDSSFILSLEQRLQRTLHHLSKNPEYNQSMYNIMSIVDYVFWRISQLEMRREESYETVNPYAHSLMNEICDLVGSFSGMDLVYRFRDSFWSLFRLIEHDERVVQYFKDVQNFTTFCIEHSHELSDAYLQEQTTLIVKKGHCLFSTSRRRYRTTLEQLFETSERIVRSFLNDPQRIELNTHLNVLVKRVMCDEFGRPDLFVMQSSIAQLKVLLTPLMQQVFGSLPLPSVDGENKKWSYSLSNAVLSGGSDLLPEFIHTVIANDIHLVSKDGSGHNKSQPHHRKRQLRKNRKANTENDNVIYNHHYEGEDDNNGSKHKKQSQDQSQEQQQSQAYSRHQFRLTMDNIRMGFFGVQYDVKRKRFPKFREKGTFDATVAGDRGGMNLHIVLSFVKLGATSPMQVHLDRVVCSIEDLKFHIQESKHIRLTKLLSKVLSRYARTKLSELIQGNISSVVNRVNKQLNEFFAEQHTNHVMQNRLNCTLKKTFDLMKQLKDENGNSGNTIGAAVESSATR